MAVRSGAGTGVIVSLVVFIFATIFGIVFTIVFYSQATKAQEAQVNAEQALEVYVKAAQRNADQFKTIEQAAKSNRQSVAQYLNARYEQLMGKVDGNPKATMEAVTQRAESLGASNASILNTLESLHRQLRSKESELLDRNDLLQARDDEIDELQARVNQMRQNHTDEIRSLQSQIGDYSSEAERYRDDVARTVSAVEATVSRQEQQYEAEIDALQGRNDQLNQDVVLMRQRIDELQEIINRSRQASVDPSLLVDGTVVETLGSTDIYIDLGRSDRIVMGMTFEIFDSADSIRVDPNTGELPRGKASAQVVNVGEQTARARITRSVPGRPVVRTDVIANAVYDRNYEYKFLVHGKFDVDGDGRPSEAEADFVRAQIIEWGGTVVTGDDLPGDLDFLVLGVKPPRPINPPVNASVNVLNEFVRKREAHDLYESMFRQAREAQIPVLNSNRFFILIGKTDR